MSLKLASMSAKDTSSCGLRKKSRRKEKGLLNVGLTRYAKVCIAIAMYH